MNVEYRYFPTSAECNCCQKYIKRGKLRCVVEHGGKKEIVCVSCIDAVEREFEHADNKNETLDYYIQSAWESMREAEKENYDE